MNSLPDGQQLNVVSLREYCDIRFASIDKTTALVAEAMEKRLDAMNEFRESLRDQSGRMATRLETDAATSRISALENWRANLEGKASQSSVTLATVMAALGLAIGTAGLFIALMR